LQLHRYLEWCYDAMSSRRDAELESLSVDEVYPGASAAIKGRLRFWDNSLLEFVELLEMRSNLLRRVEYAYHYQDSHGNLVFRYDDSPHHPEIETHPHHKHVGHGETESIEATVAPHLSRVLQEIERRLYPET